MPSLKDLPPHIAAMLLRETEADYEFFCQAQQLPQPRHFGPIGFGGSLDALREDAERMTRPPTEAASNRPELGAVGARERGIPSRA